MEKFWAFLVSGRFLPGLVILGWTLLAHASNAQFAFHVGSRTSEWLDKHYWQSFGIGFALTVLCFYWPSIRLPKWMRFPPSTKDRIDGLYELQSRILSLHGSQRDLINTLHKEISENYGYFDKDRKVFQDCRDDLNGRLDEQRRWLRGLEEKLVTVHGNTMTICHETVRFVLFMSDATRLAACAFDCADYLIKVRDGFAGSEAADAPFSRAWFRDTGSSSLACSWSIAISRHINDCCEFAQRFSINPSEVVQEELRIVARWNSNITSADAFSLLKSHHAKIVGLQQSRIAEWASRFDLNSSADTKLAL